MAGGCAAPLQNGPAELLSASHDRDWTPNHSRLPWAEFDGDRVRIHNIRNTRYLTETDYVLQHYDAEYDVRELESVDFLMTPFKEAPALAHTMLSFGFKDGRRVVVSAEARLEEGEIYHPVPGALRQYELFYVIGDERDLLPLRTQIRDVDVYAYRSTAPAARVQRLFRDVMNRVNYLERHPEFYDTINNNCTSNIVRHINNVAPDRLPLDIRVLLPGYSDELAYELGLIERHGDFAQTKQRARLTERVNASVGTADFSQRIRR